MYLITFCLYRVQAKSEFRRLHIEQTTGKVLLRQFFLKPWIIVFPRSIFSEFFYELLATHLRTFVWLSLVWQTYVLFFLSEFASGFLCSKQSMLSESSPFEEIFRELAKEFDQGSSQDLAVFRFTRDFLVLFVKKKMKNRILISRFFDCVC